MRPWPPPVDRRRWDADPQTEHDPSSPTGERAVRGRDRDDDDRGAEDRYERARFQEGA